MTTHVRVSDHSGGGGPCGTGYHMYAVGRCACGWRVEVAWTNNTCDCVNEHTADGLHAADTLAGRLVAKHVRQARKHAEGQGELL